MTICDKYQGWLSFLPDEPLTDDQQLQLDAHLPTCTECQTIARMLTELDERLNVAPLLSPPSDFSINVMVKIHERKSRPGIGLLLTLIGLSALVIFAIVGSAGVAFSGLLTPVFAFVSNPDLLGIAGQSALVLLEVWQAALIGILDALQAIRATLISSPILVTALGMTFGLAMVAVQLIHQFTLKEGTA